MGVAGFSFEVPGEPRGKGRPRFAKGRAYTDAATASYENLIALACKAAMCGMAPLDGPVIVTIVASLRPPASASKKRLASMLAGAEFPTKRPDVENIAKAVLDGMNAVAFADDAQVVCLSTLKQWAATPGLTVSVGSWAPAANDNAAAEQRAAA